MFIPNTATKLSLDTPQQIRLLLVGPSMSGKSCAAATFPNPLFVDIDNNLISKRIRDNPNISVLPFHDKEWVALHYPASVVASATGSRVKVASAFASFLSSKDADALTIEQTLVIDSLSTLYDALESELTPLIPKKNGVEDGYWYWDVSADWLCSMCTKLKTLKCHVVLIAHEQEIRDKETSAITSYKYMLPGQKFSPRLPQFFTEVYRQTKEVKQKGMSNDKLKLEVEEVYLWQIKTSPQFSCNTRMNSLNQFVPAHYNSIKY